MDLYYRELGEGSPIVILHGLYGSSDNWMSLGRELAKRHRVILVDQRNHGRSPHCPSHTYPDLVADLYELFLNLRLTEVVLLGHSMGGKTAALFAYQYPHLLSGLVVADITPFGSADGNTVGNEQGAMHQKILLALLNLSLDTASSREDLDRELSATLPVASLRQFLLKNVKREENGSFGWMLNLEALSENLPELMAPSLPAVLDKPIAVRTQFIKGELSPYMREGQISRLGSYFSEYRVDVIPGAGHWLHAEKPTEFLSVLNLFLESLEA